MMGRRTAAGAVLLFACFWSRSRGPMSRPLTPSPLSPSLVLDVNQRVNRFELDWRDGLSRASRTSSRRPTQECQPELFRQLLRLEVDLRRRRATSGGGPVTVREAVQRFAELGPWVGPVLAGLGLDPTAEPLILEVIQGPVQGRSFQLPGHGNFIVGRGKEADGVHLSFPEDDGMSRLHLLLESNPPLARVIDLRSRNGTFLNGARIQEAALRDGDEIHAGRSRFKVHLPAGDLTAELAEDPPSTTNWPRGVPSRPAIPGFRLEEEIGRGGMGIVYRARRLADEGVAAIKLILPAVAPRAETRERFRARWPCSSGSTIPTSCNGWARVRPTGCCSW